ncbi:MAG: tetratricopeptide repeat protein [bacterium]|nr:tetratricopeptide repeat protein [bacterium]
MNYSLLSFILIIIPLAVIIVVIVKKFPQLTVLDVDNVPEVKAGRKKDEVLKKRVEEKTERSKKNWLNKLKLASDGFGKLQNNFRDYVTKLTHRVEDDDKKVKEERVVSKKKEEKIETSLYTLVHEGHNAILNADFQTAENKFITAIRIDAKNIGAYKGLAEVYLRQEQFEQAQQTYEFVLQLSPDDDEVLINLGDISIEMGDNKAAIEYYQKAVLLEDSHANRFAKLAELLGSMDEHETALVAIEQAIELEPQNPKYLDMLTELSIMTGDRGKAEDAYEKLRMSNPENNKLPTFKERISQM